MLELSLRTSKHFGTYSVSLCSTYFHANGYQVLVPMGDHAHYDLAVEKDGAFQRVQCKWSSRTQQHGYPEVSLKNGLRLTPKWDVHRVAIPVPFSDGESPVKRISPHLTDADKGTIKRLLDAGKSQQEVADILGVSRGCISMHLTRSR
jgi:hypothetical protein